MLTITPATVAATRVREPAIPAKEEATPGTAAGRYL
jgi:hypothetical protein